jgi:hypothetical protein
MATAPTIYNFRQALTLALHQLILTYAVPAINSDLTTLMSAQKVPAAQIPQFGDSSVVMGDLSPIQQATICILDSSEDTQRIATEGLFYSTLTTQIQIKTARVGDNAPEDYRMLGSVCIDNLRDLLTSQATYTITPKNPVGQTLLPPGMTFQDCMFLGARSMNFPNKEEDGVTYTRGWIVMHSASICFYQNRPFALGSL